MTPAGRPPARGFGGPPVRSEEMPRGEQIRLQAHASDLARIYQAHRDLYVSERDLHVHYEDGVREAHRVLTGSVSDECPYPGLTAFGTDQARWFFGRDALVAKLLVRLDTCLAVGGALVVVAPSGAGKSSLLRAGLLAELARGALPGSTCWPQVWLNPTPHPMEALGTHLWEVMGSGSDGSPALRPDRLRRALAKGPGERRLVLVVDQLEELFTLCPDKQERRDFLDAVLGIAEAGPGSEPPPGLVVFGLRSDFYSQCAAHPGLRNAVERNQVVVGPLSRTGVREAILYPASAVGLDVEPGLVPVLLRDLGATEDGADDTGAYEIGRLPLLAHALRATWMRRAGHVLTVDGYEATGGIANSVTAEADSWFDRLDPAARQTAQSVFLRLIKFGGSGTKDTRRPVPYDELVNHCTRPGEAAQVIEKFTKGRLLTREQDTVTITHEVLLRAWPRLREWIREHRVQYMSQQRLEEAAAAWEEAGRDPGLLYRGVRLAEAQTLTSADGADDVGGAGGLGPASSEFVAASVRHRLLARRIRRGVIACLSVLAVLAAVSAVVAFLESGKAQHERNTAILGEIEAKADQLRRTDASLAAQLDLVAHRMDPSPLTEMHLLSAQNVALSTVLAGYKNEVDAVEFSPDGRVLATGDSKGVIRLWNTARTGHPAALGTPLHGFNKRIWGLVFSPDGRFLAATGEDGTIRLWDMSDPSHPTGLGAPIKVGGGGMYTLTISPDGHTLAAAGRDGRIRLWHVTDPRHPKPLGKPLTGASGEMWGLAFSPDGKLLAGGGNDGSNGRVRLWRVREPRNPSYVGQVPDPVPSAQGNPGTALWVAFSPDSRTLAAAGTDNNAHLWDVTNPAKPASTQNLSSNDSVNAVTFSRSGHLIAYGGDDSTVSIDNAASPKDIQNFTPTLTGHTGHVEALAFNPKGTMLATASADRTVRLWTIPRTILAGHTDYVRTVDLSDDGHLLASGSEDDTVRLWDVGDPAGPRLVGASIRGDTPEIDAVAFKPGGKVLAVSAGSVVRLWDVTEPARPKFLGSTPRHSGNSLQTIAFHTDGNTLAAGGLDGKVDLWNVSDPSHPTPVGGPLDTRTDSAIGQVAFSPDGHTLAAGVGDGSLHLWDITNPTAPKEEAHPNVSEQALQSVVFSPDSRTLVTSGDDAMIRLWSLTDRSRPTQVGPALIGHMSRVNALALSPDGRTLVSGSSDQTIGLWDVGDPAHARPHGGPVTGLFDYINAIVFSPDGRRLFVGDGDYTVRVLPLTLQTAMDYICRATGNALTPELWHKYVPHYAYNPPCAHP
ncbi:hypothetical protein AB0D59_05995 [Streptomyces sp. NPDC048417]|uniref:nSTAND1 domain-containing NTPase n=1 Tax=Streptomyces sp. NPDC048417 TaxID=3155387 RepID=UPI0034193322